MENKKDYTDARALLKLENENIMLADTRVIRHDYEHGWIWVAADDFEIPENTRLSVLLVTRTGFHEVLCMTHRKEHDGSGLMLSIFKQLNEDEKRTESRYGISAEGSLIILSGSDDIVNRQISVDITDISANGLGFLLNEKITINKSDKVEVFFTAKGWSMRASGQVTYVFGPRVGVKLFNIEKNYVFKDSNRFSRDIQTKIDIAFEQVFISAHYINLPMDTYMEICCMPHIRHVISTEKSAQRVLNMIVEKTINSEYQTAVNNFYDMRTIPQRLKNQKCISIEFIGNFLGVCRSTIIPVDYDENGRLHGVLHVVQKLDSELLKLRAMGLPTENTSPVESFMDETED